TSTQLRTKSKELVDALSDGQAVTLIHRSRVIGVIKPIDPDDPDLPESSSLDQQRATTQTKNPEAATPAANQPAEHDDHPMIERVEPASEPAIEENTRPTQTSYNQVDDDFLASPVAQAVQDVHHDLQAPDTGEQSQDAVTVVTDTQQLLEDRYIEQRYQGGFE